jgi:hypothetical protein
MDSHIQEAREKCFKIQMALAGLHKGYNGLIIDQNKIYNNVHLGVEEIRRA